MKTATVLLLFVSSALLTHGQSTQKKPFTISAIGISYLTIEPAYLGFNSEIRAQKLPIDVHSTFGVKIQDDATDNDRNVGVYGGLGPSFSIQESITVFAALGALFRSTPTSDLVIPDGEYTTFFYSELGASVLLTDRFAIQGGLAINGLENAEVGGFLGIRWHLNP